jgi:hypothetical protein
LLHHSTAGVYRAVLFPAGVRLTISGCSRLLSTMAVFRTARQVLTAEFRMEKRQRLWVGPLMEKYFNEKDEKDEKSRKKRYLQDRFRRGQGAGGRSLEGGESIGLFRNGRCALQSMGVFHTGSVP